MDGYISCRRWDFNLKSCFIHHENRIDNKSLIKWKPKVIQKYINKNGKTHVLVIYIVYLVDGQSIILSCYSFDFDRF